VPERPYTILSCAASLVGYLDDASPDRLLLSNQDDFDRVDALRASCDAILVGAGTVRADNPRLLVRSAQRREDRVRRGQPASPLRVVLAGRGGIDPASAVLTAPGAQSAVYQGAPGLGSVLDDLGRRGVRRLMVEGGAAVLTRFLAEDLADELQLAVAPFLVGDPAAPHFPAAAVVPGASGASAVAFPQAPERRMVLGEARAIGDILFSRYLIRRGAHEAPPASDAALLRMAVELARSCPPSPGAYSVGAIIADADGAVISTGFSREPLRGLGDPDKNHAEEVALARLGPADPRLKHATVYTSLEPCSPRASRPRSCTDLILAAGIPRVVLALREPAVLAVCDGADRLRAAGVEVVELPELAPAVRDVNAHLLG
jgi:riboflavin biosynthesis pyrimidine reductase/pyrimidine deaminase RibD-like protein